MGRQALGVTQRLVEHRGIGRLTLPHGERPVLRHHGVKDAHHRRLAALRADLGEAFVVEDERAHAILLRHHPPGRERGKLGGGHGLHVLHAAKEHPAPLVHQQQHRALALLGVDAAVGLPRAGGDLPVDLADVVARLVAPDLLEVEPAPAQPRRMPPRQQRADRLPRQQAETPRVVLEQDQLGEGGINTRSRRSGRLDGWRDGRHRKEGRGEGWMGLSSYRFRSSILPVFQFWSCSDTAPRRLLGVRAEVNLLLLQEAFLPAPRFLLSLQTLDQASQSIFQLPCSLI